MLSSMLRRASGPPMSVRTHPEPSATSLGDRRRGEPQSFASGVFSAALLARYTSEDPDTLLATLPCPEDITPIVPGGR